MFEKGFNLLKENQFEQAFAYFEFHTNYEYSQAVPNLARCRVSLYGKARAFEALGYFDEAKDILIYLIEDHPYWETPYLSLGRIFEKLKFLATAEVLFLQAAKMVPDSKMAQDHYRYFLRNNLAQDGDNFKETSRVYIPGFTSLNQTAQEAAQANENTELVENLEKIALADTKAPAKTKKGLIS